MNGEQHLLAEAGQLTKDQRFALCGLANCGCVYHAEEGEPCIHDLRLAVQQGKFRPVPLVEENERGPEDEFVEQDMLDLLTRS